LPIPAAASNYYQTQQTIAVSTVAASGRLWSKMGDNFEADWAELRPQTLRVVQNGRLAAAVSSVGYVDNVLAETGQAASAAGAIVPQSFVTYAPDGRNMGTLLDQGVIRAKVAVGRGATPRQALAASRDWQNQTLLTVMADTGRAVVGADIAQRPSLTGYVRMLNTPSCSRCTILAGKWFRWNEGFQRHPQCDCRHIPAPEGMAGSMTTDPYAYFNSLSEDDQNKLFKPALGRTLAARERAAQVGISNARAIRAGGDIYRIENITARGLGTPKSALRYGTPSQMTVDDIYRVAGTRKNAIELLTQQGYITGPQTVGGNVIGVRQGFGQLGKGGRAKAARDSVLDAVSTGVRDPLNRYTMTAGERRLFDAKTRVDVGRAGTFPRSIGANTADRYAVARAITPVELATLERVYATELAKLAATNVPDSIRRLASLLEVSATRSVLPALAPVAEVSALASNLSAIATAKTSSDVGRALQAAVGPGIDVSGFDVARVNLAQAQLVAKNMAELLAKYPEAKLDAIRIVEWKKRALAQVYTDSRAGTLSMEFKLSVMRNPKALAEKGAQATNQGFWNNIPENTQALEYVTKHEFGHVLDKAAQNVDYSKRALELQQEAGITKEMLNSRSVADFNKVQEWRNASVSKYGQSSKAEKVAEGFADVEVNGANAKPYSWAIYEALMKGLGR
jgi:hypothetical protein